LNRTVFTFYGPITHMRHCSIAYRPRYRTAECWGTTASLAVKSFVNRTYLLVKRYQLNRTPCITLWNARLLTSQSCGRSEHRNVSFKALHRLPGWTRAMHGSCRDVRLGGGGVTLCWAPAECRPARQHHLRRSFAGLRAGLCVLSFDSLYTCPIAWHTSRV
jgi:hypothetical protein